MPEIVIDRSDPSVAVEDLVARASALNLVDVIEPEDPNDGPGDTSIRVVGGKVVAKSRGSRKKSKRKFSEQYLKYLLVLDFEATCFKDKKVRTPHEIIEFPVILYNLATHEIEDQFHTYVKPTERGTISAYCTQLTGITQETVDAGVNIRQALKDFDAWLISVLHSRSLVLPKFNENLINGNVAFAIWGDWDFGVCLKRELSRKSIKRAPYYNNWIDVRALYMKYYKYRPLNFADSLSHLNITFEGRAHSGIVDATNLATLCGRMVNDGHLLYTTSDLMPNKYCFRPFY